MPEPLLPTGPHAVRSEDPAERSDRLRRTADVLFRAQRTTDGVQRAALLEQAVLLNLDVAASVARRFRGRGVPQADLEQIAFEGLTKAVQRFDPATGNDLLTFAVPTIRGELQRFFRDQPWAVRVPRRIQELQSLIVRTVTELTQELGREPGSREVRERARLTLEEYAEAVAAFGHQRPASLDQPIGDGTSELGELLRDDRDGWSAADARILLAAVLPQLSEREQLIVSLRFFEDRTQAEIGQRLGVTQMQVSRLLTAIIGRLRELIGPLSPPGPEAPGAPPPTGPDHEA